MKVPSWLYTLLHATILGALSLSLDHLLRPPLPALSATTVVGSGKSLEKGGTLDSSTLPWPVSPSAYCLADANGVSLIYHFFILSVAALGGMDPFTHTPIYNPAVKTTITVYAPWLSDSGNVNKGNGLWAPVSPYHLEAIALMEPYFRVARSEPKDGCIPMGQTPLLADDQPEPSAHRFISSFFKDAVVRHAGPWPPFDPSLRVFITRKTLVGPRRREVLNGEEVERELSGLGFRIVALEALNLTEKIKLFASARVVVSTQSASLLFSAFMDRRGLVVELYPDNGQWNHYFHMTKDLGVPYRRFSKGVVPDGGSPMLLNMRVDAGELGAYITQVLQDTEERAALGEEPPLLEVGVGG